MSVNVADWVGSPASSMSIQEKSTSVKPHAQIHLLSPVDKCKVWELLHGNTARSYWAKDVLHRNAFYKAAIEKFAIFRLKEKKSICCKWDLNDKFHRLKFCESLRFNNQNQTWKKTEEARCTPSNPLTFIPTKVRWQPRVFSRSYALCVMSVWMVKLKTVSWTSRWTTDIFKVCPKILIKVAEGNYCFSHWKGDWIQFT